MNVPKGYEKADRIVFDIDRRIQGEAPLDVLIALTTAAIRAMTSVLHSADGDTTGLREDFRSFAKRVEALADCPQDQIVAQSVAIQEAAKARRAGQKPS